MSDREAPSVAGKNVLFVFADQMHAFAMGCAGTPDIHTPNLDRLAQEGVLFTNAYSNCPVCTPFRANLFTGRYSSQTGVLRNSRIFSREERTLARAFNEGGYRTSYVGKWHLGDKGNGPIPEEMRGDFTELIGYQCYNGFWKDVCFYDESGCETRFDGRHRTDVTTDIAIERLTRIADQPFAMFVSYQNPHYPVQPSPEYAAMYAGKDIQRRPNCVDVEPYTQTFSPPSPKPASEDPDYQKYGGNLSEYHRLYYAMVTQMDANIGRLLDTLEELGHREDTVVIFTSDHGDLQGSHGLTNKSQPHEESSRIPLIVRVPGGAAGVESDAAVSGVDLFPTCLEYAGLPPEPAVEGVSLAGITLGEPDGTERTVFSEMRNWAMVRQGRFKFVASRPDLEPTHLFDLDADPYEMTNLVADAAHAPDRDRLLAVLREWHERVTVDAAVLA